jgi:hypothetical protein
MPKSLSGFVFGNANSAERPRETGLPSWQIAQNITGRGAKTIAAKLWHEMHARWPGNSSTSGFAVDTE